MAVHKTAHGCASYREKSKKKGMGGPPLVVSFIGWPVGPIQRSLKVIQHGSPWNSFPHIWWMMDPYGRDAARWNVVTSVISRMRKRMRKGMGRPCIEPGLYALGTWLNGAIFQRDLDYMNVSLIAPYIADDLIRWRTWKHTADDTYSLVLIHFPPHASDLRPVFIGFRFHEKQRSVPGMNQSDRLEAYTTDFRIPPAVCVVYMTPTPSCGWLCVFAPARPTTERERERKTLPIR